MNLFQSVQQATHSLSSGFRDAVDALGRGLEGSVQEFARHTADEFSDVGAALRRGDWLDAGLELAELASPGAHVANALDATGVLPADPFLHNALSAGVNLLGGGLSPLATGIALGKDLVESGQALHTKLQPRAQPGIAAAHTPLAPEQAYTRACSRPPQGYPTGDAIGAPAWHRPRDAAKACMSAHPYLFGFPPLLWLRAIERSMRDALRDVGFVANGGDCRQKPLRERSVEDILRDPSLTFEDQVAMFMAKVMEDMEDQVKEQMRRMDRSGAPATSETGDRRVDNVDAHYSSLKDALADGAGGLSNPGPGLAGVLDFFAPMVPALASLASAPVGTAVGAAIGSIVPGAGTALGAAIGGMVSAALPVVLPLLFDAARDSLRAGDASPGGSRPGARPASAPIGRDALVTRRSPAENQSAMTAQGDSNAMQTEMERLKILINRMQQMQQAMSNVLNTMHQGTMNIVRNIR